MIKRFETLILSFVIQLGDIFRVGINSPRTFSILCKSFLTEFFIYMGEMVKESNKTKWSENDYGIYKTITLAGSACLGITFGLVSLVQTYISEVRGLELLDIPLTMGLKIFVTALFPMLAVSFITTTFMRVEMAKRKNRKESLMSDKPTEQPNQA